MRKKEETSKTRKILQQLQKLPGNRSCAECGSKQAMWASTNLGVFMCIRCSSVHRAMGTHISKVKSATLDIWKMEMVEHFRDQGGNKKVNSMYEANLPPGQKPTTGSDMYVVERFIRDKYERKTWYSKKKSKSRKKTRSKSNSSSDSDENNSDSESSESTFKSSRAKKKKMKKKIAKRRDENSEVKDKHMDAKLPELVSKVKKKKSPAKQTKPVVDILDVSVLSFGDETEAEKSGFDSKTFVDDLLSADQDRFNKNSKPSADVHFGDFFGRPPTDQNSPIASSPPQSNAKPNTNDILGMFKKKILPSESLRQPVDIFGAAGPRAQPMHPMGLHGPPMQNMPMQNMMMRQNVPLQNVQIGYSPVMSQPVMNQNVMYGQVFNQAVSPQTNTLNLIKSSQSGFTNQRQSGFNNPKPQSSAFDALMSGNVPIKSQPPSTTKTSSSRYVPSKPTGPSLNIDLNGWMN